jgi:hypothetical protein
MIHSFVVIADMQSLLLSELLVPIKLMALMTERLLLLLETLQ